MSPVALAALALGVIGVGMRLNNAFRYPIRWGFDAKFNWIYIERLTQSWSLPSPEESWSTAHPPLFYYVGAAVARVTGIDGIEAPIIGIRLLCSAAGLGMILLAAWLVLRSDPGNLRRALLAAGLLLFLPAHIYMSAMLNEEVLAATFTSLAVCGACAVGTSQGSGRAEIVRAGGIGLAGGLAVLTKLSGALAVAAAVLTYAVWGLREGKLRRASGCIALLLIVASCAGGWYYARNQALYGYLYPQGLEIHDVMRTMPPGERSLQDYLYVPAATWLDPQLLSPDLLRSVWGSTHATLYFDGHRAFLPRDSSAVRWAGTGILTLALLPILAFAVGLFRGARRALAGRSLDIALGSLVALTLAGYVLFTWRNPWFAVVKGSYLLGCAVPFAYYASEVLDGWSRRSPLVWGALGLLGVAVMLTFTYGPVFAKWGEIPGLEWRS